MLRNIDGTPLVGQPVVIWNGTMQSYQSSTNANGNILVAVPALALLSVAILPSTDQRIGWGIIVGTSTKSLVASALVYGAFPWSYYGSYGGSFSFSYSIPINGGSPF